MLLNFWFTQHSHRIQPASSLKNTACKIRFSRQLLIWFHAAVRQPCSEKQKFTSKTVCWVIFSAGSVPQTDTHCSSTAARVGWSKATAVKQLDEQLLSELPLLQNGYSWNLTCIWETVWVRTFWRLKGACTFNKAGVWDNTFKTTLCFTRYNLDSVTQLLSLSGSLGL